MSLRDKLRGRRRDDGLVGDAGGGADGDRDAAAAHDEVTDFSPRQDGDYHCADAGLYLRFSRPVVIETQHARRSTARGEFTQSGRFTVQREFERPVVYTVLEAAAESLLLRRTDTADRTSKEWTFVLEPDQR